MDPDHIAAWRKYLAEKMQERYGIGKQEAQKGVTLWLQSLNRKPEAAHILLPSRVRNQRTGLPARRAARQARSARA
jgi:hypothetical protein